MKTLTRVVTAFALVLLLTSQACADIVTATLNLEPLPANQLTLGIPALGGSATTDLSGTILAKIDIDLSTGVISSLELDGGAIAASYWSMATGVGLIEGINNGATTDTPAGPAPVTGTTFDATLHELILNSGTINIGGAPAIDLAADPAFIPGAGLGTLTSTLNGGVYDIFFQMEIDDTQVVTVPGAGNFDLTIAGTIMATGQVVPEPSSGLLALTACFAGLFVVGRRKFRGRSAANA